MGLRWKAAVVSEAFASHQAAAGLISFCEQRLVLDSYARREKSTPNPPPQEFESNTFGGLGVIVRINILNWDKFNPKRDQKTYTWLRLQNDIATDNDLYGLSAEQKWVWVVILCEASKQNRGDIEFDVDWLAEIARVKKGQIESLLRFLEEKPIISKSLPRAAAECRHTTPTYERTNDTYERTNIHADSPPRDRRPSVSDFETLYVKYPRKEGKAKGILACKAQIQSLEDMAALSAAIERYAEHVKRNATEPRYIKHFSTFMSSWRDWLDPEAGTAAPGSAIDWNKIFKGEKDAV